MHAPGEDETIREDAGAARSRVSFDDEPLICVDANDRVTGHKSKSDCHDGQGILHRALSVFLFDSQGRVLLQQRSENKRLWPLYWANSCCSHPRRGEQVDEAASRRLREELGIITPLTFTHRFLYQAPYGDAGSEHELCSVYVCVCDDEVRAHPDEICDVAWWQPEDLDKALYDLSAPFTPWLRLEWHALRQSHWPTVQSLVGRAPGEG